MEHAPPAARPIVPPAPDVYTVTRLNREAKTLLEASFPLLWIEGEVSNLRRPTSGHVYFSLKDARAQVNCALFRPQLRLLAAEPRDGMHVLLRARVSLYEGRGDFQLVVEHLEDAGEGALKRAFEALKARLSEEGLFDAVHKKPLPRLPRRLGLITSESGAVVHDILTTLRRRFPAIPVLLYPVPVQGEGAAEKIAAMIRLAGERRDCDALILARGGGSLEDLRAFNEEIVARAVHACPLPLVCGVGHETDFTIADLVADARAPTPTAAAELLSPDRGEWEARYRQLETRLARLVREFLRHRSQRLDGLAARVAHPRQRLERLRERLGALIRRLRLAQATDGRRRYTALLELRARLQHHSPRPRLQALELRRRHVTRQLIGHMRHHRERAQMRLAQAMQALQTLSPLATLERGYAIVQEARTGAVLREARAVRPGERVRARLARGVLDCVVQKTHEK
jgi:exodeoxyribonuclease VII large subunit